MVRRSCASFYANVAELAALGLLGRSQETADALGRARRLKPDISIALVGRTLPIGKPEVRERFHGALRAAGVPETA